jgi:hypothetical protein
MIAGERLQKQTRELFTDGPARAKRGRGLLVLVPVQAGTVLEDHRQCTGLRLGGVHDPSNRRTRPARGSLPGVRPSAESLPRTIRT